MPGSNEPVVVLIASPLEDSHVQRIRAVDPRRVEVVHEPGLLPAVRYTADHDGVPGFVRDEQDQSRWRAHVARAEVLWDFPREMREGAWGMDVARRLRWVQTTSSGVGQLVAALGPGASELLVTTARGVHAQSLAEFAFMALLLQVKGLRHLEREQRAHRWQRYCGQELAGKILAVVGAGEVGRRVAELGRCFGMGVVASIRNPSDRRRDALGVDAVFAMTDLHLMLAQADAVVLSVPHTPQTEGMMDAAAFSSMKKGAVLVNVARGAVVDEPALVAALGDGTVGFAALDVFATEPLPPDSALWDLPNVLVSPHSASTVASENGKITELFCHNLRCYLDGDLQHMRNILDQTRMY